MKPIGLAFKNYEVNPFTCRGSGELMIIHQCINCGKISPNRIAGDDNEYHILSILEDSLNMDAILLGKIKNLGINIISPKNKDKVLISLFGTNYKKYT
jgi:hypothetical protein